MRKDGLPNRWYRRLAIHREEKKNLNLYLAPCATINLKKTGSGI